MGKKILIGCGIAFLVLVLIGVGIGIYISQNVIWEARTTVTRNGEEITTYTAIAYYEDMDEIATRFYDVQNDLLIAQSSKSEIEKLIEDSKPILNEMEALQEKVDEIRGDKSEEYDDAVTNLISTYRSYFDNQYLQLANVIGEDGTVESQEEEDQANSILEDIRLNLDIVADEYNIAAQDLINSNTSSNSIEFEGETEVQIQ